MKDGTEIRKQRGETLVQAAARIGKVSAPVVLLGFVDQPRSVKSLQTFYQGEPQRARIVEVNTDSEESEVSAELSEADSYIIEPGTEASDGMRPHKVYLSVPRGTSFGEQAVHAAERSVTGLKTARREIFDGVHMKAREKSQTQALKRTANERESGEKRQRAGTENLTRTPTRNRSEPGEMMNEVPVDVPEGAPLDSRKVGNGLVDGRGLRTQNSRGHDSICAEKGAKSLEKVPETGSVLPRGEIQEEHTLDRAELGGSMTLNSQFTKLLLESAQLARVWMSVWSLLGGWAMIHLEKRIRRYFISKGYKEQDEEEEGRSTPAPKSASMSLSSPPNPPPMFALPPTPPAETYEPIRYLVRPTELQQGVANEPLDERSPEQAVRGAVYDQWRQYHNRNPLDVQPAFMASPQSVYYGPTVSETGQTVHNLTNLNGAHVLTNPETGQPFIVAGHSFTTIFEVPRHGPWYIEAPYPAEARIQDALERYVPSVSEPLVFPARSTPQPPPLPRLYQIPQARWAIPTAQHAPSPAGAAPVTIATSLAHEAELHSQEGPEMIASLFTGTTNSSNDEVRTTLLITQSRELTSPTEQLLTPDYPDTPSITEHLRTVSEPTEPPASVTPSSNGDSLPDLIAMVSDDWKDELANRLETALRQANGDDNQQALLTETVSDENDEDRSGERAVKCAMCLCSPHPSPSYEVCPAWRAPSPLYSDMLEHAEPPSRGDTEQQLRLDNGGILPIHEIDSGAEIEIIAWITGEGSGKERQVDRFVRQQHEELMMKLQQEVSKTMSAPSPASRWKEGEEELEIRAYRASALYQQRVNGYTFAIATTPPPPVSSPRRDVLERPRNPYVITPETQRLLAEALAATRTESEARTDRVAVPFLGSRGAVIHREHWSSSPEANQGSADDSEYGFDDLEPYSHALSHNVLRKPSVSTAIIAQPSTVLDALVQYRPSAPDKPLTAKKPLVLHPSKELFGDTDSARSSASEETENTDDILRMLERVTGQKRCAPIPAKDVALGTWNWVMDLAEDQDVERQRQVDWCLEAFQDAYGIIFGVLECHLDPTLTTGPEDFDYRNTWKSSEEHPEDPDSSPPRPDQAATSLDYSLPNPKGSAQRDESTKEIPTGDKLGTAGDKRKREVSREERNKRFPAYYAHIETIRHFAEARAALKQGLRRTQQLALDLQFNVLEVGRVHFKTSIASHWFRPYNDEQSVPMEWKRPYHSLLTQEEADRLRVLQLACGYEEQHQLAGIIHHLLHVRFRNEHALGHLLAAGFLDSSHDKLTDAMFWEALDGSDIEWDDLADVQTHTSPRAVTPEHRAKRARGKQPAGAGSPDRGYGSWQIAEEAC
ncbi:hypothetical protein C8J57DRAFT_1225144 [Mycena rebaudengoi]|nr:hypothetical protein C8J57DRAFT_1225144 [Mycena rebaudengoi]